tara:strand:+ start:3741 stop:4739 length:999 start_codon:yes stop_codon:yes gene_type:complete
MIVIKKYDELDCSTWDNFIKNSNNGTIFQKRKFLNYHLNRKFNDCSLIFKKNNKIIALFPAAEIIEKGIKILYSHPGSSYGGLILNKKASFEIINSLINALDSYLVKNKFRKIFLINSPDIYWNDYDASLDYLLLWNSYLIKETYISHAANLTNYKNVKNLLSKRKKRYIENDLSLKDVNFRSIKSKQELKDFYRILELTKKQFCTQPTHSLQELQLINNLFPKDIEIFVSEVNNEVKGGVVVFHVNSKTSLIFYNVIDINMKDSQLSSFQLYNCLKICKKRGSLYMDLGVSQTPESKNPLEPKFSLIKFKESFGCKGSMRIAYEKEFSVEF